MKFAQEQCAVCRELKIKDCAKENPAWFEPHDLKENSGHYIIEKNYDQVWEYVNKNTDYSFCIVLDDSGNDAYCTEHVHLMSLDELSQRMKECTSS